MTFKEFLQFDELQGAFGSPKALGVGPNLMKAQMKTPFGKGKSFKRMIKGPSISKPARPVGVTSPMKPMTVSSFLK